MFAVSPLLLACWLFPLAFFVGRSLDLGIITLLSVAAYTGLGNLVLFFSDRMRYISGSNSKALLPTFGLLNFAVLALVAISRAAGEQLCSPFSNKGLVWDKTQRYRGWNVLGPLVFCGDRPLGPPLPHPQPGTVLRKSDAEGPASTRLLQR